MKQFIQIKVKGTEQAEMLSISDLLVKKTTKKDEKELTNMKNKICSKIFALTVFMVLCFIPMSKLFAAEFNYNQMNLSTYVTSRILPLNNLEGNLNSSQANRIMKNGFLTAGAENYGFFRINLNYKYIGDGRRNKGVFTFYIIGSVLLPGVGPFILPMGDYRYNLSANVEILDVNKNVIKNYPSTTMFDGIEWGYTRDYTFAVENLYRELLKNCLTAASKDADKINTALINAKLSDKIPAGSRIAVIGANQNADVIQGARQIEAQLIDAQRYRVVDRVSIDMLIAEINFSRSVFVSEAIEVGRMLSAQYIVYVEITGEGSNKKLNFRIMFIETGEVIASFANPFK